MKKILTTILFFPLAVLAAGDIPMTPQQMQTLGIHVMPLAQAEAVSSNRLPGEIMVPVGQERMVSAPQGGLIDALYVAAGQQVKRGQALAHISSADLVALQRDYLQGKTQQKLAKGMLERDQELYREGIIAERRLLTTQSAHEELTVAQAQRRQALKLAGMGEGSLGQLDSKGDLSSGLTITAPMDGVVLEQLAAVGQRVDMSAPIYRIARLKPLWLEIHAPLEVLAFVREGMAVTVPKYQAEGKIITIIRSVNRDDQTVHLRAEISKGVEKLSPGQFVEAEVVAQQAAASGSGGQFSVPKTAVVRNAGKTWLFIQSGKGFKAVPVNVIHEQSDHVVISANLTGKEQVAVSGTVAIKAAWMGVVGE